jgi:hypothetical protein
MPRVGFESTILVFERAKTLSRKATDAPTGLYNSTVFHDHVSLVYEYMCVKVSYIATV